MMPWVLIVWVWSGQGSAVTTQRFVRKEACINAATWYGSKMFTEAMCIEDQQ